MVNKNEFDLICRPARPEDTQDVMELTSKIWEGDDYVPRVWPDWLADPLGLLAVAEHDGRVVGMGKLTRLAEQQWWLEGLRAHPDLEGRGIASHLHDYLVEHWARNSDGILRLATASFRLAVQHLCDRTGFDKVAELTPFKAPAVAESTDDFRSLVEDDAAEAVDFANASQTRPLTSGLMDLGWHWTAPAPSLLLDTIQEGNAWWWRGRQGLLAITPDDWDDEPAALIRLVACPLEQVPQLLADYRRLAAANGYRQAIWNAPLHTELLPLLQQEGFQRDWDASLYIYAKVHPSAA